jgi:hypothetical protein
MGTYGPIGPVRYSTLVQRSATTTSGQAASHNFNGSVSNGAKAAAEVRVYGTTSGIGARRIWSLADCLAGCRDPRSKRSMSIWRRSRNIRTHPRRILRNSKVVAVKRIAGQLLIWLRRVKTAATVGPARPQSARGYDQIGRGSRGPPAFLRTNVRSGVSPRPARCDQQTCASRALSVQVESESALLLKQWSHFLTENRCPLFRKML